MKDDKSGVNFNQREYREANHTEGSYAIQLPDTRLITVTYYVDGDSGYVADVAYAGEAQYPPEKGSAAITRNSDFSTLSLDFPSSGQDSFGQNGNLRPSTNFVSRPLTQGDSQPSIFQNQQTNFVSSNAQSLTEFSPPSQGIFTSSQASLQPRSQTGFQQETFQASNQGSFQQGIFPPQNQGGFQDNSLQTQVNTPNQRSSIRRFSRPLQRASSIKDIKVIPLSQASSANAEEQTKAQRENALQLHSVATRDLEDDKTFSKDLNIDEFILKAAQAANAHRRIKLVKDQLSSDLGKIVLVD